ncbi:MerR family transcriptional regulator [Hyphomonas sp.]|uniref:MerR family transcriptional regulator n=1 Tax=Hyphomonas sp. TaxID=87 RepID=UPI003918DF30
MTSARARIQKSPDAYRTIGEASAELGLEPHVLRYWESRFPAHVSPAKRPGGRRLYTPRDMAALKAIRLLVHEQGMTLAGAKAVLAGQGVDAVLRGEAVLAPVPLPGIGPARALQETVARAFGAGLPEENRERLNGALNGLEDVKYRLDALRRRRA